MRPVPTSASCLHPLRPAGRCTVPAALSSVGFTSFPDGRFSCRLGSQWRARRGCAGRGGAACAATESPPEAGGAGPRVPWSETAPEGSKLVFCLFPQRALNACPLRAVETESPTSSCKPERIQALSACRGVGHTPRALPVPPTVSTGATSPVFLTHRRGLA